MPRHSGLYWQQWEQCNRCGFIFPIGQLVMQKGLLVCTSNPRCYDDLDVELRSRVIADVLADTQETEDERVHVTEDPQDIDLAF